MSSERNFSPQHVYAEHVTTSYKANETVRPKVPVNGNAKQMEEV
jgi:hypothetical protein